MNVFSSTADGILAALLAPFFMSLGFFIWDHRWTSSGASAFALNMYKCNVASIGFVIMCLVRGFAITPDSSSSVFTPSSVGFLILSSFLGIIVGDVLWLEALRLLGAKHVIVVDSLKPFAAAILGRVALDEVLRPPAWGGMVLTVVGVGVVAWEEQRAPKGKGDSDEEKEKDVERTAATERIGFENEREESAANVDAAMELDPGCSPGEQQSSSESTSNDPATARKRYRRGYACAIVNVLADSLGSLLTKQHGVGMTTWSINLIRFGFAGVVLVCISSGMRFRRRHSRSKEPTESKSDTTIDNGYPDVDPKPDADEPAPPLWFELPSLTRIGWVQITAGVGLVTFLCPALSNYALFQIALGLAVSLGSIGPLYGLVLDWPFRGKRPTACGCAGVLAAVAGVVVLCVWGT